MEILKEIVEYRYIIYSYNSNPEGTIYVINDPGLSPFDARNAYRFKCTEDKIKEIVKRVNKTRIGKWVYERVY